MRIKKIFLFLGIAISVIFFSFSTENFFEINKNIGLFIDLYRELNNSFVDPLDHDKLVQYSIDGMLESLDPYTNYFSEENESDYNNLVTGKYGGIGAIIHQNEDYVIIAEPYDGSPAAKAGLLAGDEIIAVDGKNMKGATTEDVSDLLRGPANTTVKLTIKRPGQDKNMDFDLKREEIVIKSVPYATVINVETAYIRLTNFTENCAQQVRDELKELQKNNNIKNCILDVRDNPGGLLNEAVDIASIFLPKNEKVVTTRGRDFEQAKIYTTHIEPLFIDLPLAILANNASASASEIVAGVIQDYDRGIIVGEKTFGKGLVQSTKEMGYNSHLKITTAKYYLPSGRCIQAIDYSGKYKDGGHHIPDSLRTAFTTQNGRVVYDAGGIDPEIEVEVGYMSDIAASLFTKQLIFEYATQYVQKHPSIPPALEFKLTDTDYNDFVQFLSDKEYDYATSAEILLEDLEVASQEETIYNNLSADINELKNTIKHDKQQDLQTHKKEIKRYLQEEISSRYYYQKGRIETSLLENPFIKAALDAFASDVYKKSLQQPK
ncbi:MAG: S41 family peptidase [Chitinophagales bacterium]|nr:S41 family peptidase [Bacteroidota bacterium]MCB9042439.1 S41 family peptidase [Chitinophagales bacterium]